MNPDYGYAKKNPNGKSLTTAVAMPFAALALWFPFTPGGGIGSSRGNWRSSGRWNLTVGRTILVCSAIIRILAVIWSCWRNG